MRACLYAADMNLNRKGEKKYAEIQKNIFLGNTRILRNAVSRLPALFHKIEVNL